MADTTNTNPFLSIVATTTERVRELPIKNGQLIFARDEKYGFHRIAFDRADGRIFYNQITVLECESDRIALTSPIAGYYFIIDTASFWRYQDGVWDKLTKEPDEIIFIGTELPTLGQSNASLYINKAEKEISIFDEETDNYIAVANYTKEISDMDIESLFK